MPTLARKPSESMTSVMAECSLPQGAGAVRRAGMAFSNNFDEASVSLWTRSKANTHARIDGGKEHALARARHPHRARRGGVPRSAAHRQLRHRPARGARGPGGAGDEADAQRAPGGAPAARARRLRRRQPAGAVRGAAAGAVPQSPRRPLRAGGLRRRSRGRPAGHDRRGRRGHRPVGRGRRRPGGGRPGVRARAQRRHAAAAA